MGEKEPKNGNDNIDKEGSGRLLQVVFVVQKLPGIDRLPSKKQAWNDLLDYTELRLPTGPIIVLAIRNRKEIYKFFLLEGDRVKGLLGSVYTRSDEADSGKVKEN